MRTNTFFCFLLFIFLIPFSHADEDHWGYHGENGPEHWYDLDDDYKKCKEGKSQSPFNIQQNFVVKKLFPLRFSYRESQVKVINNGHTIQVTPLDPNMTLTINRNIYKLLQFHFHIPSEYQINQKSYPMEVHFVHKNKDGKLGVLGVMVSSGTSNPIIKKIWSQISAPKRDEKSKERNLVIDLNALLPKERNYLHFMGSLTTPPCSENVSWYMMKTPIQFSEKQIKIFKTFFKENARPLQKANNRLVVGD